MPASVLVDKLIVITAESESQVRGQLAIERQAGDRGNLKPCKKSATPAYPQISYIYRYD
jgi:hypothetical protein